MPGPGWAWGSSLAGLVLAEVVPAGESLGCGLPAAWGAAGSAVPSPASELWASLDVPALLLLLQAGSKPLVDKTTKAASSPSLPMAREVNLGHHWPQLWQSE